MKQHHPILPEIDAFLKETGMAETYFGKRAAGNSELVARLRDGGSVHFKTEAKIRKFMAPSFRAPSSGAAK